MIIRKIRLFLRDNKWMRVTIYPFVYKLVQKFHLRARLVQAYGPKALSLIQNSAKESGIVVVPYYGTLLGLVREKSLLRHDADMDFAIPIGEQNIGEFYAALVNKGFLFEKFATRNNRLVEFSVRYKEVCIDFFLFGLNKKRDRNIFVFNDRGEIRVHSYPLILGCEYVQTEYGQILIPINSQGHLLNEYGEWRIPNKQWDARRGPSFRKLLPPSNWKCEESREIDVFENILKLKPVLRIEEIDVE